MDQHRADINGHPRAIEQRLGKEVGKLPIGDTGEVRTNGFRPPMIPLGSQGRMGPLSPSPLPNLQQLIQRGERRRGAPGRGNPELGGMVPTGREIDP